MVGILFNLKRQPDSPVLTTELGALPAELLKKEKRETHTQLSVGSYLASHRYSHCQDSKHSVKGDQMAMCILAGKQMVMNKDRQKELSNSSSEKKCSWGQLKLSANLC